MSAAASIAPLARPVPRPSPGDRARAERMSLVVHDFRQPLNVIALSVSALELADAPSDGTLAIELERIRRAVKTLARMTADLLDASALEAHTPALQSVPLGIAALAKAAR